MSIVKGAAAGGEPPDVQAQEAGFHGLRLQDTERSKVVQFRVDGFTLNQLAGYTTADVLFTEALQLWQGYTNVVSPAATTRVALRYINKLLLPFRAGDDFERFLTAAPAMPSGSPQGAAKFLTRVVVPVDAATAIVTQQLDAATEAPTPFVLDIDVFRNGEFDLRTDTLEPMLQSLREIKNRLLFSFLTDEALEPYR